MLEFEISGRQILTSKDNPRAERVKLIMFTHTIECHLTIYNSLFNREPIQNCVSILV